MNDLVDNVRIEGSIEIDGENIYAPSVDTTVLRKKVGMVFQQPNPFPMSIYDNIAYGPRVHGIKDKKILDQIVEESLQGAAIFNEVKDRLKKSAMGLSGGQQQRLCIARALAVQPEVLLMDEAFSALDPLIRVQMQDELLKLQEKMQKTIIFITHDLDEAIKLGDRIAIMKDGEVVQVGTPEEILTDPANHYVSRFTENVDRGRNVTDSSIMITHQVVARIRKDGPETVKRKIKEKN